VTWLQQEEDEEDEEDEEEYLTYVFFLPTFFRSTCACGRHPRKIYVAALFTSLLP
jgi:hypothetical protein